MATLGGHSMGKALRDALRRAFDNIGIICHEKKRARSVETTPMVEQSGWHGGTCRSSVRVSVLLPRPGLPGKGVLLAQGQGEQKASALFIAALQCQLAADGAGKIPREREPQPYARFAAGIRLCGA